MGRAHCEKQVDLMCCGVLWQKLWGPLQILFAGLVHAAPGACRYWLITAQTGTFLETIALTPIEAATPRDL